MTETFAVTLVGEEDRGWLVDATSAIAAVAEVRERTDERRMTPDGNWYVWPFENQRAPHLLGIAAPGTWLHL